MVFRINAKRLYKLQDGADNKRTNNALYRWLRDNSDNMETDRVIIKGTSDELLKATSDSFHSAPIVLKESEVIKVQAQHGGDLHVILSVLEIS